LPGKLEKLTLVELRDLVTRSRTARDKWRDVGLEQKRTTQAQKGHRQNAENARSEDKARLLDEVHQQFVNRLEEISQGQTNVEPGKKASKSPRRDRKIETRAERSVTREILTEEKRKTNRKASAQEKKLDASNEATTPKNSRPASAANKPTASKPSAKKTDAGKIVTNKPVAEKTSTSKNTAGKATVGKATAAKTTAAKTTAAKTTAEKAAAEKVNAEKVNAAKIVAEKAQNSRTSASKTSKKKMVSAKKPIVTKARKKMLAKQAAASAAAEANATPSKPNLNAGSTHAAQVARNRPIQAKSTANRIKIGGNTRIKGHIASQGKRSQARRDGK
jgi:hypothetical protein